MECRGLGENRFMIVRTDAVEHGVTELVIDDVGREAGKRPLALSIHVRIEVVELKRLAIAVVVGVLAVAGVGHDDKSVAFEAPLDTPPQAETALEEVEGVLERRPDIHLAELRGIRVVAIDNLAFRSLRSGRDRHSIAPAGSGLLSRRRSRRPQSERWSGRRRSKAPKELRNLHQNRRRDWISRPKGPGNKRRRGCEDRDSLGCCGR